MQALKTLLLKKDIMETVLREMWAKETSEKNRATLGFILSIYLATIPITIIGYMEFWCCPGKLWLEMPTGIE